MTVFKLTEIVGTSGTSVSDAIHGAVERASMTIDDLQWFEVKEIRGRIRDGNQPEYQVRMEIGFLLHAPENVRRAKQKQPGKEGTRQARSIRAQIAHKGSHHDEQPKNFQRGPKE